MTLARYILLLVLLMACGNALASEFRTFQPIATPGYLPEGAVAVKDIVPADRKVVEGAVKELVASWNTEKLQEYLGDDFYDKNRLQDTIQGLIPRDAAVRVLSVQNQQTIGQFEKDGVRTTRVSVTVMTQIEYNDPARGFQRLPGTVELTLSLEEDI